ncbi:MAG: BatD family protein, partial [Desulfatibacillaceae bacterium]|nr:BatD family protein [Desulfatibacillaceae bacterium]
MTFDRPGVYELGPSRMEVPVLIQTRQGVVRDMRTLFSEPVTITIEDFPQEGRPAGFSGLVGKFSLEASLSDDTLSVGDSTTLSIRFSGSGAVRHMPDPEFAPLDGIRSYAGAVQFSRTPTTEGTQGVKSVEWALVPQEAGSFVIKPKAISFLNPDSGAYELAEFEHITLAVKPAADTLPVPAPDSAGEAGTPVRRVELLAQDIQTINEAPRFRQGLLSVPSLFLVLVVILLPPLVFLAPILIARRLANNRSLAGISASRKALSLFQKQAGSLPPSQAEALQKALLAYLSARLGLPGGNLTPDEACAVVVQAGADAKDAASLQRIMERLDACVFGCMGETFSGKERDDLL